MLDRTPPGSGASRSDTEAPMSLEDSALASEPSFLLARSNARSMSLCNHALAPLGLKVRSYSILVLAASDARPSQRDLAAFLKLDPSQVVSLVDELESHGLVERIPDPRDRRTNAVVATTAGARLASRARDALADVDAHVFAGFDASERQVLDRFLWRIAFVDNADARQAD